jgi:hypothetical protein
MVKNQARQRPRIPSRKLADDDHLKDPLASASSTPQASSSTRTTAQSRAQPKTRGGPTNLDDIGDGGGPILDGEKATAQGQMLASGFGKSHEALNVTGSSDRSFSMPYEGRGSADMFTGTTAIGTVLDQGSMAKEFAERWPEIQRGLGSPEEAWSQAQLHDLNTGGTHASMGVKRRTKGTKRAVVVGNSDYNYAAWFPVARAAGKLEREALLDDLPAATGDAKTIAGIYTSLGFEVQAHSDLSSSELNRTLQDAESGLVEGDELLIYYAGHGNMMGVQGIDANIHIATEAKPNKATVPYSAALDAVVGAKMGNFHATVIFDSCHSGGALMALKHQGAKLGEKKDHNINLAEEALRDAGGDLDGAKKQLNIGGQRFRKWDKEQAKTLPGY